MELRLLGGFEVKTNAGCPVPIARKKAPALLAYLACPPGAENMSTAPHSKRDCRTMQPIPAARILLAERSWVNRKDRRKNLTSLP